MTAHSAIGPSALARLLACAASYQASKGKTRSSSAYASEGSVAHEMVEAQLADAYFGKVPAPGDTVTYEGHQITVDDDMVSGVDHMVNFCRPLRDTSDEYWLEQRVDLGELWDGDPPEPIFGTVDFAAYFKKSSGLHVVDFKYGRMSVAPNDNPQAMAYALGLCFELGEFPRDIHLTIIQPRGQDGKVIKTWSITGLDLMIWACETLKPGVDALFSDTAKYATGDHCRFCAAKPTCPALYELAKRTSRTQFDELPPDPINFDDAELANVLDNITVLEMWFASIRAEASGRVEKGKSLPGWKLVPKRAIRAWTDPAETEIAVNEYAAVNKPINEYFAAPKIRSPTQIEKLDKALYDQLVESGLVQAVSSGSTLAPDHDPRAAVANRGAKDQFQPLEDHTDGQDQNDADEEILDHF